MSCVLINAASIRAAKAPKSPTGRTSDKTNGALIWLFNVSVGIVESDAFTESATD